MKSLKLIGLALGASLALSTAALAQDITIAVAGPMTGGESAFGRQMKNGAEQAIADLNAAGGVLGKKLALEIGDDACDPKQARSVAEKIASAKIPFVAGHFCSSSSIPARSDCCVLPLKKRVCQTTVNSGCLGCFLRVRVSLFRKLPTTKSDANSSARI